MSDPSNTVIPIPAHPRALNAVRAAINARAKATGASETQRRHALGVAFDVIRTEARSTAWAIFAGCRDLRPHSAANGCAPGAA